MRNIYLLWHYRDMAKRVPKAASRQATTPHRAGRYTSQDVHEAVFETRTKKHVLDELKDGIRRSIRKRRARA